MPTSSKIRKVLFSSLPLLEKGKIVELGSGWGHLLFPLAKKYKNCQVVGYENSPIPYIFSLLLNHASNLKIIRKNFFYTSLKDADLIICYLFPKGMAQLKTKFKKELKPTAKIISHTFAIPGWKANHIIKVDDIYHSNIYFYDLASK